MNESAPQGEPVDCDYCESTGLDPNFPTKSSCPVCCGRSAAPVAAPSVAVPPGMVLAGRLVYCFGYDVSWRKEFMDSRPAGDEPWSVDLYARPLLLEGGPQPSDEREAMRERCEFLTAACRDAQEIASQRGWALHAIVYAADDLDAARQFAKDGLLGAALPLPAVAQADQGDVHPAAS